MNPTTANSLERQSNFELLRLLCMFFILFLHVFGGALDIVGTSISATIFESFFVVAVNCFVLISGYFSIKASWKGFIHLYIFCTSYYLGFGILDSLNIINPHSFGIVELKRIIISFFPFTHSGNWFLQVYFCLFVISPLLNKLISLFNKYKHISCLVILTIVNIWVGFYAINPMPNNSNPNANGYNIMHFVYLYFIGRYIYLYLSTEYKIKSYLLIYILLSLILSALILLVSKLEINDWYVLKLNSLNYNNPLILLSSISLFLVFRKFKVMNKKINWLAKSALAVFIIHTSIPYGNIFQYLNSKFGLNWYKWLLYFLAVIVVFFMCLLIDKIRMLITNPIENILSKINVAKYYDFFLRG
ncbi:acyltransferase family protein [Treponema primitia]|uniref:acyltransferase family protein n=1 Tax=Treponema primitia TaxID=88058 RepID=UPI00031DF9DB|nr:acyltransferase [Treponema primitia]